MRTIIPFAPTQIRELADYGSHFGSLHIFNISLYDKVRLVTDDLYGDDVTNGTTLLKNRI
jgi:hypothetical protein